MFYFEEQLARNEEKEEEQEEYRDYIENFAKYLDTEEAEEIKKEVWGDPEAFFKRQREDNK